MKLLTHHGSRCATNIPPYDHWVKLCNERAFLNRTSSRQKIHQSSEGHPNSPTEAWNEKSEPNSGWANPAGALPVLSFGRALFSPSYPLSSCLPCSLLIHPRPHRQGPLFAFPSAQLAPAGPFSRAVSDSRFRRRSLFRRL